METERMRGGQVELKDTALSSTARRTHLTCGNYYSLDWEGGPERDLTSKYRWHCTEKQDREGRQKAPVRPVEKQPS